MSNSSEWISIGQIVGALGLRGQVKVMPLTDFHARFEAGNRVMIEDEWYEILECSWHRGRPNLRLTGLKKREDAEKMQWKYLKVPADSLPTLEEDEYLLEDLIGLQVETEEGEKLGEVTDVLALPAQDVLVIGEIMIPVVDEFVKEIDLDAKLIRVKIIPGMRGEEL